MSKQAFVYIMTNRQRGTLYIGVATNLAKRAWEHRQGLGSKFTSRYGLHRLVHIEPYPNLDDALQRERRLKKWKRAWKIELIEAANPDWHDLYEDICR